MSSLKQIEANQLNAQKSTGPKTPEGRAAVRLNAIKHGLNAQTLVLPGENPEDFEELFQALEAEHDPSTPTEQMLVVQLAMASWRLLRIYGAHMDFVRYKLKATREIADKNDDAAARMVMATNFGIDGLIFMGRSEARLERTFFRCLHELERLRAARPVKAEIGSVLQKNARPVEAPPKPESDPEPVVSKPSPGPNPSPKPLSNPDH